MPASVDILVADSSDFNGGKPVSANNPLPVTLVGGGSNSTSSTPTGVAGSPNPAVISVQGVAGGTPQPISAAALPLPAGAATAANQSALHADGGSLVHITNPTATQTVAQILAPPLTGQVKIVTTNTAVQLPTATLTNGIAILAKSTNAAQTSTYSSTVGSSTAVTTAIDGTGNGYPLAPGGSISFSSPNANQFYVNGTVGDVFFYAGS